MLLKMIMGLSKLFLRKLIFNNRVGRSSEFDTFKAGSYNAGDRKILKT